VMKSRQNDGRADRASASKTVEHRAALHSAMARFFQK